MFSTAGPLMLAECLPAGIIESFTVLQIAKLFNITVPQIAVHVTAIR